jgi:hypothetical protein
VAKAASRNSDSACTSTFVFLFSRLVGQVKFIAGAFAINHPLIDTSGTLDLMNLVFENHPALLLKFAKLLNAQAFFDKFQIATELPEEAHEDAMLSIERQLPIIAGKEPLKNLLHSLFVQSWNAYLAVKADQQRQLDLQEFLEASLKDSATAPVAMMLDGLTLESPELQEFVTSAIANQTKSLQSQVSKLNNQLNAKNQSKGAHSKPIALTKEQKGRKNQPTRQNKSTATLDVPNAADAANSSTDAAKNCGKQKKKSRPRKNASNKSKPKSV